MRVAIETERQDIFDVGIVIAMRVHISGKVTEDSLRSAFEKAVKSHEILNTRIVIEDDGKAFYVKDEQDKTMNTISFEDSPWMDVIHREEKIRMRLEDGQYLKAFVYEMDGEGCSILFLMHHLGGDGKSMVYFIETFMRCLAGESVEYLEMQTIPAGDMSDDALKDKVGPLMLLPKHFNKKWLEDEKHKVFTFDDLDKAFNEYWADKSSVINEYVITPEMVSKILSRCKEWEIGFTAYITTSFLRRFGRKLEIGYAVDAREDGNRCMGNQATGISIKYAYNYDKPFMWNAKKVQKLMNNKLEDDGARNFVLYFMAIFDPTLEDAMNLQHAGAFNSKTSKRIGNILGYGKKCNDLSITNLTKLDIPDTYGNLKLDYFSFIPPVISYGRNIIGLSTLGDCTVMTVHRIK
ncbi:Condensation domain-containing protein [Lachnospiraceae bacterium NE2001]|nr:Condensation domain-containing protein [Lachnospiraceae bacterium NE2001]